MLIDVLYHFLNNQNEKLQIYVSDLCRPVSMAPQMAPPAHTAGLMMTHMSRQNGAPQTVTPSSTNSSLHGGSGGGWTGAGARPQFNNQVNLN